MEEKSCLYLYHVHFRLVLLSVLTCPTCMSIPTSFKDGSETSNFNETGDSTETRFVVL
jgi:hypothetical protein